MSSRFDPEYYVLYRPLYPVEVFAGLESRLRERGYSPPFGLADIGCGTGHSTISLLRTGMSADIVGIDPDPRMLDAARILADGAPIEWRIGTGEATGLEAQSVDAVTIGSAFHWMNLTETRREMQRILRPGGFIRIFEYQFPKSPHQPELNEWIRREFNLRWRAPEQKPRGSLRDLANRFLENSNWKTLAEGKPSMVIPLGAKDLTGLILSQSRVLHFEDTLDAETRKTFRAELENKMRGFLATKSEPFDFKLGWIEIGQ